MSTTVQSNSSITNKLYNSALFLESSKVPSLSKLLSDGKPTLGKEASKAKGQTSAGAPIVRIEDLSKTMGDEVTVDIFHQLRQKPVMGDKKLEGKGASMEYGSFTMKINQGRTMVDSGGKMSQQRTQHDLRKVARSLLMPYYARLDDQQNLVHVAGARGDHNDADWIVPLESDPDFAEIMVNPVTPPTFDRHFYGGDATSIDTIDAADKFTLAAVDKLRLALDEMPFPLQPIRFEEDQQREENPFYVMLVTPRQWYDFWTSTNAGGGSEWRTLQANAHERRRDFNHPIFVGDCVMWNNILIKKQRRPIRFNTGTNVTVCTDTANAQTSTLTAGVNIERAILLGAQALGVAFGSTGGKGTLPFKWHDEPTDHDNLMEHSIAWIKGNAKIRFEGTDGRINDHGAAVLDTAVS